MRGVMIGACLLVVIASFSNARNYYGYGYGYHRPSSYSYNKPRYSPTSVTSAPFCSKVKTMLRVLVVEQVGGEAIDGAYVRYVDSKGMYKKVTDSKGIVNLVITGCSVGLTVYRKNGQSVYKDVDLKSSTSKYEKVVVTLHDACNFWVFFNNKGLDEHIRDDDNLLFSDVVTYMYQSGDLTGQGMVVGNRLNSPTCITTDMTSGKDNLKMIITSQSGNLFNILDITDLVNNDPIAYVSIPLATPGEDPFDLYVFLNIYEVDIFDTFISNLAIVDVIIRDDQGEDVSSNINEESLFFSVDKESLDDGTTYLIAVKFNVEYVFFEGNAALIGNDGCDATTEINDEQYADGRSCYGGYYWIIGCMCDGADIKKYREVNTYVCGTAIATALQVSEICGAVCNP